MMTPTNRALALGAISGGLMVALDAVLRAKQLVKASNKRGAEIPADEIEKVHASLIEISELLEAEFDKI